MVGALGLGLGVLAGGAAGAIGGLLLGGTKKEQTIAQAQEQQMGLHIEPYGVYTPTYAPTVSQQLSYTTIIESAGAVAKTEQAATQTPTFTITPIIAPVQEGGEQGATQGMGIDPTIIIIAGALILGYMFLKKKGGKKK